MINETHRHPTIDKIQFPYLIHEFNSQQEEDFFQE